MTFYKVDATRVTMREFWWETKLFFWVGLIVKVFKMRIAGSTDDLAVDSLRPFLVDPTRLAPHVPPQFEPTLKKLQELGFEPPTWLDEEDRLQGTRNTLAILRHSSGKAWAQVQQRTNFRRVPARVKFFTTFISRTNDGYVVTGNGKYDMAWPASHDKVRFRKLPAEEVWARHQARLIKAVQPVSPAGLIDAAEQYHISLRDFHVKRGVFQPVGEAELALLGKPAEIVPALAAQETVIPIAIDPTIPQPPPLPPLPPPIPAPPVDLMELSTLDELRALQNKKVNWRSAIGLLAISALVFIAFSRGSDRTQSREYLAIVVGVLLFHETGHYLAMKLFGYRNLRMFFIPGFGAAVSGRHYNAPAWKKILVSLMGPLPGIVVGSGLLIASRIVHNDLLYRIGLVGLLINAFNLLPIVPLDGGWVAHAALFSRHPKLDVGFRIVAALALIALGFFLPGMKILLFVGIATLIAVPIAGKLAEIVSELRRVPGLGASPDDQTIPPQTARIILTKVRERFPRNLNARMAAGHIVSIFESLNARPPSAGATVGLLGLYFAGFGVVIAAVLATAVIDLALKKPATPIAIAPHQIVAIGQEPPDARNTVVAHFKSDADAATAFTMMGLIHPASRFGWTVLVDFAPSESAAQQNWLSHCQQSTKDVFVEGDVYRAEVQLWFRLPNTPDGQKTFQDLSDYFSAHNQTLLPPWATEARGPTTQPGALTGQSPASDLNDFAAPGFGIASSLPNGQYRIRCRFIHVDTGLPALSRWLFDHGATEMRYLITRYSTDPFNHPE